MIVPTATWISPRPGKPSLGNAFSKATKWISKAPPYGITSGRSFFSDHDGSRRQDAPSGANRVDTDIYHGQAFKL